MRLFGRTAGSRAEGADHPDGLREDYRPGFSRVLVGVFVTIVLWWVIDLAVRGRPGDAAVVGLWSLAAVALLVAVFWRPAVLVDDVGIELRNVVRDVRVPWPALESIDTRYTLTLHAAGRRFQSWAGAAPGRPGRFSGQLARHPGRRDGGGLPDHALPDPRWAGGGAAPTRSSRDLNADSGAAAFLVERRWEAWRRDHPDGAGPDGAGPDGVAVVWRPLLPAVAACAAALAVVARGLVG
jgi:hypothetical protein